MRIRAMGRLSLAITTGVIGLLGIQVLSPTGVQAGTTQNTLEYPYTPLSYTGVARQMTDRVVATAPVIAVTPQGSVRAASTECLQVIRSDGRITRLCR